MTAINYIIRFDGASRGNPGHSSYGFVIYSFINNIEYKIYADGDYIGKATNNQAEYRALLASIKWCKDNGLINVRIEGDSQLVINQVRGVWIVRDKILKSYYEEIVQDLQYLKYIELRHIDRGLNIDADTVCNKILDSFLKVKK